jgi:hypothetical protein
VSTIDNLSSTLMTKKKKTNPLNLASHKNYWYPSSHFYHIQYSPRDIAIYTNTRKNFAITYINDILIIIENLDIEKASEDIKEIFELLKVLAI